MCLELSNVREAKKLDKNTRAEQSLRSALWDFENLEYGINIFKNMKWAFFIFQYNVIEET